MSDIEQKPGRKPEFGARALTQTEKTKRMRKKEAFLREVMLEYEYVPLTLFIHRSHINALSLLSARLGGQGRLHENPAKASEWVWRAIREYVKCLAPLLKQDSRIDRALLDLVNSDKWPELTMHEVAANLAQSRFWEWSDAEFGQDRLQGDDEGGDHVA